MTALALWATWLVAATTDPPCPFAEAALAEDVMHLAAGPRDGRGNLAPLRAWLAARLTGLGFTVTEEEVVGYGGRSVIGLIPGRHEPAACVVVSAHLDTVADSPGADDNASGVAAALAVAAARARAAPARTLIVAFWDLEERGLRGSAQWAARARAGGREVVHALSLESVGYRDARPLTQSIPWPLALAFPKVAWEIFRGGRRGDFVALVGNARAPLAQLAQAARTEGLPHQALFVAPTWTPLARLSDLGRSDHASFWAADFGATMVTDTAPLRNPHYHRPQDLPATLDWDYLARVARLVDRVVAALLIARAPT